MKNVKRSITLSVLSLIVCVAMLIGTTFAWFTDSASSGVNKITAGNLDIEVSYKSGNDWFSIEGADSLFDKTALWEPGHTEYVNLKIENKGTLALKYRVNVTPVSESGGVNMAGESFKLSDYLVFGTTEPSQSEGTYTRETARAAVGTTAKLNQAGLTKNGTIAANGDAQYITLVVYMPETVGNEANYMTGTTAPQINLGVNVIATQLQSESDSFDNTYDSNTDYDPSDSAIEYNYFPQVNVTGQLVISGTDVKKGSTAGEETSVTELEGNKSRVILASPEKIDTNTAAKLEVVVNRGNLEDGQKGSMTLKVVKDDTENANFQATSTKEVFETDKQDSTTYQVTVECEGVTPVTETDLATYKIDLFIGKNRSNVKMYHSGNPMTENTSKKADTFTYDPSAGYCTMYVDTFSPFTVVYDLPVASIGSAVYYSLQEAVDAAKNGDTITLLQDIEQSNSVVIDKNIVLNLNGKKITDKNWAAKSPTAQSFFYVKSDAKLTINDTVGTGIITTSNDKIYSAVCMTINGQNDETKTASLIVNGGTLKGYYYGIVTNGNRHNTDITINGGTLTGYSAEDATSIYHPCQGKLTVNGGTLIGYDGLAVKGGTVNITGGKLISTGAWNEAEAAQGSGSNSVGAALYVEGNYGYAGKVNVSGGEFVAKGTNGKAVYIAFNEDPKANINITGGTFSSDPSTPVNYVADGYKAKVNGTTPETWTVKTKDVPKPVDGVFSVSNTEQLNDVIEELNSPDTSYTSGEYTIKLGAGVFGGTEVEGGWKADVCLIKQYPQWNGCYGNSANGNNTQSMPSNHRQVTIIGNDSATERTELRVIFVVAGFGYSAGGNPGTSDDDIKTVFQNIDFDFTNCVGVNSTYQSKYGSKANHDGEDGFVPIVACGASSNVTIVNCNFTKIDRIKLGYSGNPTDQPKMLDENGEIRLFTGYTFDPVVKDCTFTDCDTCIDGYFENSGKAKFANITCTGCQAFVNSQSSCSDTLEISGCDITCVNYLIRTNDSSTFLVKNCKINITETSEEDKYGVVTFRGKNNHVTFEDCTFTTSKEIRSDNSTGYSCDTTSVVTMKGTSPKASEMTKTQKAGTDCTIEDYVDSKESHDA